FENPIAEGGYHKSLEELSNRFQPKTGVGSALTISGGGNQDAATVPVSLDHAGFVTVKNTAAVTEEEMMTNRPTPDRVDAAASEASRAPNSDDLGHGDVVIAAITSCTNTSNPSVMLAAGVLAKKAV